MKGRRRIEICGAIAAGKSTLARLLELNGYTAIYERFEDNPFLKQFYQNTGQDNTFETELVFALLHYNQMKHRQEDLLVSDYSMLQDYCYALQNLTETEKGLFINIYEYLLSRLMPIDLIIYLRCGVDCLQERIRERSRDMESTISREYLQRHIEVLEKELEKAENVLIIDSEKYDFRGADREVVLELIDGKLSENDFEIDNKEKVPSIVIRT